MTKKYYNQERLSCQQDFLHKWVSMIKKEHLEELLTGKVIVKAVLERGTVKFYFTDGTWFEREKTCDGEIIATLFTQDQRVITCCKI